jgi:hypothetical protein
MPIPVSAQVVLAILVTIAVCSVFALFHYGDTTQLWDVLKLALQGIGAIAIARLTVVWAVDNFKSQKRWERDASTYAATVAALREMKRVIDILWGHEVDAKPYTEKYIAEAKERSVAAKKKFEECAAAAIFLPSEISSIILQLESDLANRDFDSYFEYLESEDSLLSEAIKQLESKKYLL